MKKLEDNRTPAERWLDSIKELVAAYRLNDVQAGELSSDLIGLSVEIQKKREAVKVLFDELFPLDPETLRFADHAALACLAQRELDDLESLYTKFGHELESTKQLRLAYRRLILKDPCPEDLCPVEPKEV